jgi:opacity protein-like surface antigen
MKKLLLSISLLLISYLNYSQNSNIKFGIHAGLNYSTFYGYDIPEVFDPVYSESPAFAFLGGINIEYQIKEKLSLKLELNYERKSQKGNNNNIAIGDIDDLTQRYNFTSKKNNDYLVLPIMVKYNFGNKDSFYANGGPFIGYLLKSNITNDLGDIEGINNGTVVTTDLNNKTDFGLAIGLGKMIEINEKNSISIEIRENLGLTNTSKGKVWGNGEAKTNSLNLIIGYQFN